MPSPLDRTVTRPRGPGDIDPAARAWLFVVAVGQSPATPPARHCVEGLRRVTLGRGPSEALTEPARPGELDLRVPDPWMSSRHATLDRVVGSWVVADDGSKNGTLVNGRATRRARLSDGDLVEVGSTALIFRESLVGDARHPRSLLPTLDADAALPPLARRREDLGVELRAALEDLGATSLRLSPDALHALLVYDWPGDVPELRRAVESAVSSVGARGEVSLDALPRELRGAASARPPPSAPASTPTRDALTLTLEGEVWALSLRGQTVRLRDGDGPRYLAYLMARPGLDIHATELAAFARGPRGAPPPDAAPRDDDALPTLDARARAEYQRRLAELREELDEATRWSDTARAEKVQAELDAIAREVARAVGMGGRDRAAGGTAERARVAVTMRIKATLKRVTELAPAMGRALEESVRTGTFCRFEPPGGG